MVSAWTLLAFASSLTSAFGLLIERQLSLPLSVVTTISSPPNTSPPTTTSPPATTSPGPPTSTSPASPPPVLVFHQISQLTACGSATIGWVYKGSGDPLSLLVSNNNVQQSETVSTISETLSTTVDPNGLNYTWNVVNVPQGFYDVQATVDGYPFTSNVFFVSNGSDVSCLGSPTPSASPITSPSAAPTDRKMNTGAIAGGVVGGLVILAAVAGFFFFLCCRKSAVSRKKSGSWGGLNSSDSKRPSSYINPGNGSKRGAVAPRPLSGAETVRHRSIPPATQNSVPHTPGGSVDFISFTSSPEEKEDAFRGPFDSPENSYVAPSTLDDANGALYYEQPPHRRASNSSQTYSNNHSHNYSRPRISPSPSQPPNRRVSAPMEYPSAEMIPMGRSASGSVRRTPRKPVPQYSAREIEETPSNNISGGDSRSSHQLEPDAALGTYDPKGPASASEGTLESNGALHGGVGVGGGPILSHKASFGDRPVHYLIPDMPPPTRV